MYCSAGEMCSGIAGLPRAGTGADLNSQEKEMQKWWCGSPHSLQCSEQTAFFPTGKTPLWAAWGLFLSGTAVISKPDSPQSIPLLSGGPQIMAREAS